MRFISAAVPVLLASTVVAYYTDDEYFNELATRQAEDDYYNELAIRAFEEDFYNVLVARKDPYSDSSSSDDEGSNSNYQNAIVQAPQNALAAPGNANHRPLAAAIGRTVQKAGQATANALYNTVKFGASHKGGSKIKSVGTITGTTIGAAVGGVGGAFIPYAGPVTGPVIGALGGAVGGAAGYGAAACVQGVCKQAIKMKPDAPYPNAKFGQYNPRIGKKQQAQLPAPNVQAQLPAPNVHLNGVQGHGAEWGSSSDDASPPASPRRGSADGSSSSRGSRRNSFSGSY